MRAFSLLGLVAVSAGGPVSAGAETDSRILHDPPECVARSAPGFPLIRATLAPSDHAARVRIHLRGGEHREFYRLDLRGTEGSYEAILPRPGPDTRELVYFFEVVDASFHATTTPEFRVPVVQVLAECSGAEVPESEGPPGVPVPNEIEAPLFPLGFEDPPAALQSPPEEPEEPSKPEEKESKRRGVLLALGAAAGAGLSLGLLSGGADIPPSQPEPPAPPPEPPSPPPPPIPIPIPALVQACFELPRSERVGVSVRIDASCSSPRGSIAYEWQLGDGRTREGRVVTPIYRTPGLYTVELTVSRLEPEGEGDANRLEKQLLIIAGPPAAPPPNDGAEPVADLAVSKSGQLTSRIVDGVLEFHVAYTLQVTNLGPNPAGSAGLRDPLDAGLTLTSVISSTGSCAVAARVVTCALGTLTAGGVATVRLDVDVRPGVAENTVVTNTATVQSAAGDPAPSNNQATETTVLRRPSPLTTGARSSWPEPAVSFVSTLSSPRGDGSTSATIRIGERSDVVNDRASFHHRFRSRLESIMVEGVIQRASGESRWRFDFSSDPRFAPGSLEVQQGEVLSLDSRTLTFRLGGQPGERIRFSYRPYH